MTAAPEKIGPYRIVRKLGEGGMGAVFEGLHELIERRVAIKILHPEFAAKAEFTARFFNEARAVNRVDHPGLVQISDYGQLPDNTAYIVMEFLHGETLSVRLKSRGGPLSLDTALNLGSQLAESLAAAHEKNVIHRDLKPDNVMLVADSKAPGGERTKLLDFGIAKLADEGGVGPGHIKTNTNSMLGTPYYMSPEQCRGAGKVDGRSDVYALGVMMYEMLAGVRPITGEGQGDILVKHITEEPVPLRSRNAELPETVTALVHRMMIKDREKRPAMAEVAAQLEALSMQYPPPSVRRSTANMPLVSVPQSGSPSPATQAGTAAGQTDGSKARGRSRSLIIVAAVALIALLGVGARALRPRPVEPPASVPAPVAVPEPAAPTPVAPQDIAPKDPAPPSSESETETAPSKRAESGKSGGKSGSKSGGKGKKTKPTTKLFQVKGGRQIED